MNIMYEDPFDEAYQSVSYADGGDALWPNNYR